MRRSEAEHITRKDRIDPQLQAVGWEPIVPSHGGVPRGRAVLTEHPTAHGPADYVLFDDGQPLAIVEAKRVATAPQNVLEQDKRYARGLHDSPFDFDGYGVPFIYSTNGVGIWFQDLRDPRSRSRKVAHFHTPAALRAMLAQDAAGCLPRLADDPTALDSLRPYQRQAIEAIETALGQGQRTLLVAMATGTGKTRTAVALIYRLMKTGFARRVLFLVDRRALAAQTAVEFSRFEAEPGLKFDKVYEVYSQRFRREDVEQEDFDPQVLPTSYLTHPDRPNAFVYVSTIQRMRINLFGRPAGMPGASDADDETDADILDIPIHAFDVVIADESHRGYTSSEDSKWREVLNHFDAARIGLTATPAAHTTAYFGKPVFSYGYERAVREGYLVDYDPVLVHSTVTMQGAFLRPGEDVTLIDRATGEARYETLEDERELPPSELDTEWTATDRDRQIVAEVAHYLREQETERSQFPKTLVFAHNDAGHTSHADRLVNLLRDEFGRGDAFVQKITGNPNVDRPLQKIRQFRNRPEPGIVVTVEMLSTGVDIPALENIVFLRPIKSRILFEQMMGRGTRLCPEIGKTHFTVFDAVGVLTYFAQATEMAADPPAQATRPIGAVIRALVNNEDRAYNTRVLVGRLQRIAHDISAEGREAFAPFIPNGDIGAFAAGLPAALETRWAETARLLTDPVFQRLLTSYRPAPRTFLVAETVTDSVTSERLIHTADGRSLRPQDYLAAFESYVRANPDHIEAIRILLERPRGWRVDVLDELRRRLRATPEGFNETHLRLAYDVALADIISLVKHAARGEPLLTAEERVDRALAKVRAGRELTPEQERWLGVIRGHLIENLGIERRDFTLYPFTRQGATWTRVDQAFGGHLENLINDLNEAIAA